MYIDLLGVLAGVALAIIGLYFIWTGFRYYRYLQEPGKRLAWRFLISASLFTVGSIGTTIDSLAETQLWFIMAISYSVSYMILVSSVVFYIKALCSRQASPGQHHEKVPILPISGAYAFRKPASSNLLAYLSRISSGLLVVSRTKKELWVKEHQLEPDEFIWLSRMDEKNVADPTKLHVLQDSILRFLKEKGGRTVVYFEGTEYLTLYNDFSSVAKFLFSLKDHVISNESMLILYLPSEILDKTQESVLLKEFQEKNEEELLRGISQKVFAAVVEGDNHAGNKSAQRESGASEKKAEKA